MRRSRGRLTLGVHKIPFLEFSPGCSLQGLSSGRIVAIQTEFCTFDSCKMEGSGDTVSKLC